MSYNVGTLDKLWTEWTTGDIDRDAVANLLGGLLAIAYELRELRRIPALEAEIVRLKDELAQKQSEIYQWQEGIRR